MVTFKKNSQFLQILNLIPDTRFERHLQFHFVSDDNYEDRTKFIRSNVLV